MYNLSEACNIVFNTQDTGTERNESIELVDWLLSVDLEFSGIVKYGWRTNVQGWIYDTIKNTKILSVVHNLPYSLFTFSLQPIGGVSFLKQGFKSKTGYYTLRIASALEELVSVVLANLLTKTNTINNKCSIDLKFGIFNVARIYKESLAGCEFRKLFYVNHMVVISKEGKFMSPDNDKFYEAVISGVMRRWEVLFKKEFPGMSIKFEGIPDKRIMQYKDRNLLTFSGDIRIEAPPELKTFVCLVGLGQKPSAGFGMVI